MKYRMTQEIDRLADNVGASGWSLIRENRHLILDFYFGDGTVRQVMAATGSDKRMPRNARAQLRRDRRSS